MADVRVSVYDNPHKLDQCNVCGKKKERGEDFYNSPDDIVHNDGAQRVAHEKPVCKACYEKQYAAKHGVASGLA
jgi:hypothetical protein